MSTVIERLEDLAKASRRPDFLAEDDDQFDWRWPMDKKEPYWDWLEARDEFAKLMVAQGPDLLSAIRALVTTAWSERDGRCWCASSPELRDGRHEPRCALARAALEPLFAEPQQ